MFDPVKLGDEIPPGNGSSITARPLGGDVAWECPRERDIAIIFQSCAPFPSAATASFPVT